MRLIYGKLKCTLRRRERKMRACSCKSLNPVDTFGTKYANSRIVISQLREPLIQILLVREGDIMRYRERLLSGADKRQAPGVWYWQAHAAGRHGLALHKLGYTEAAKQQLASAAAFYSLSLWRRESCLASHASLR